MARHSEVMQDHETEIPSNNHTKPLLPGRNYHILIRTYCILMYSCHIQVQHYWISVQNIYNFDWNNYFDACKLLDGKIKKVIMSKVRSFIEFVIFICQRVIEKVIEKCSLYLLVCVVLNQRFKSILKKFQNVLMQIHSILTYNIQPVGGKKVFILTSANFVLESQTYK